MNRDMPIVPPIRAPQGYAHIDPRQMLSAIVDSSDDAIISKDLNGTITSWNRGAERLFGYSSDEIIGQPMLSIIPNELHFEEEQFLRQLTAGERIEHYETERLHRDQHRVHVSVTISPIVSDKGDLMGASMIVRDVSTRRAADDARFRLAAIVESSDDAIVAKDLNGIIYSWNAAAERLFGYKAEEIIGRSVLTLIPEHLQTEEPEILRRIRANQKIDHYSTQRISKSGKLLDVSLTISPIRDQTGKLVGASKIVRDMSEKKTADELQARLAAIVESSDDAIIGKDLNGIITSWNSGAKRLFGYEAHEIIGQSVLRLIPPHLQSEEPEILRKLMANQRIDHHETQRVSKSGKLLDVSLTISPIRDAKGNVIGASKIARDASERKRAQLALIESEKLVATARMAATIAHEINNPLESVTNLAYLLARHPSLDETARNYAEMMLSEVGRASDIARQTLAFYRDSSKPNEVNVAGLFDSLLDSHEPRLRERNIHVIREFDREATVWGFASELKQVFMNLLLNAVDALPGAGNIAIRVRASEKRVVVFVADNGCGIATDMRRQIFEPFFTTKTAKGNGLGLWVSKGIIGKHNGLIRVRSSDSNENHGTVFIVTLPRYVRPVGKSNVA
jgi:PAS domain S-box-containing protein